MDGEVTGRIKCTLLISFTDLDEEKLREPLNLNLTENNLNEYGRFDVLVDSADIDLVTSNLSVVKGEGVRQYKSKIYLDKILRKFLLREPFSLKDYNKYNKDSI